MKEQLYSKQIAINFTQNDMYSIRTTAYLAYKAGSDELKKIIDAMNTAMPCSYLSKRSRMKYFTVLMTIEDFKNIANLLHDRGKTEISEYIYDEIIDMCMGLDNDDRTNTIFS